MSFATTLKVGFIALFLFLSGCAGTPAKKEEAKPQDANAQAVPAAQPKRGFEIKEGTKVNTDVLGDYNAAVEALNEGDTEKGIALMEKVAQRSPTAVAPYINLGIAYKKIDKLDKAEENLKSAIKLSPDHPVANNEYGMLYRKTGRFAEARATYEKIIGKYPDYMPARRNLGVLCDLYLRDLECAYEQYQIYSAAVPGDKSVAIWVADLKRRLKK